METTACVLCGGTVSDQVREACDYFFEPRARWRYVRCRTCGFVYLNPRPTRDEMPAHYPAAYFAAYPEVMKSGNDSALMRLGFTIIRRRRVPDRQPGRVLDVGCGSGFYLAMLRGRGWAVEGIDPSAEAARHARELNGLDVRLGSAETILPELADGSFDLVTLWHVLEHLFDPVRVLTEIRRLLKPDGLLMLEVPNFSSVCSLMFRSYWAHLEPPRHLFQFTPDTLTALLTKIGYQVDRLRGIASPQNMCASVNLAGQRWLGRPSSIDSVYGTRPVVMAAAFPAEWLLAHVRLSGELSAVARRPV